MSEYQLETVKSVWFGMEEKEGIPKKEGLPHDIGWFDENVVSGFTQTGAKWKETDELARSMYDMMKPQVGEVL